MSVHELPLAGRMNLVMQMTPSSPQQGVRFRFSNQGRGCSVSSGDRERETRARGHTKGGG